MKSIFALSALLPFVAFAAPQKSTDPLPARVDSAIHARMAAGEYPAIVVAMVDGKESRVYTYGKLADGKAPEANTVFEIGSVTKTFTATALAHAVLNGSVELDEPVARLLPQFAIPSRGDKTITLENLATQHSGLPRLPTNLEPADIADPYADYDGAKLKAFLASYKLSRDPGSKYEYSNLGVGLLGYALAQHAGVSYNALLQQQVFGPLGMDSSATILNADMRAHLAHGHDAASKPVANWTFAALAGAGAIKSTAADMLRYLRANMGVLKSPLYPAMQLAHKPRRDVGGDERIGLTWMTKHDKDGDVIWHNGMTGGYASFIGLRADGKRGVVILTNIQQSVDDLGFATLLADAPLTPAHEQIAMTTQQLDDYVGSYRLAPKFVLKVFRDDDQLHAQATGQGPFPIFPSATDVFFAKVADIRINFQRDSDGKVKSLVLHQGGHDSPAAKMTEAELHDSGEPKAMQLDAAVLKRYVGRYQLAPGAVFTISIDKGQLMAQLTGQAALPVTASAKDEFFYTAVDAQLSFKRDKSGKITALVLHQGGIDQRAERIPAAPDKP